MINTDDIARYYCLSILDKHHNPDISLEEGLKLLTLCTDELKRRLPIDFKGVSYIQDEAFWPTLTQSSTGFGEGDHEGWSTGD
jgi:hypothetical protein